MKVVCMIMSLVFPLLVAAQEPLSVIEQQYNEFVAADDAGFGWPEPERIESLEAAYAHFVKGVASVDVNHLTDHDVTFLYRAAHRIHFYTYKSKYRVEMARYLAFMEARHIARSEDRLAYYRALVAEREFTDANRYAEQAGIPVSERLPERLITGVDPGSSPAILELSSNGQALDLRALDSNALHVVVVATPWCHFARGGVEAIEAAPDVADALSGKTIWLMPVEGDMDIDGVRKWNTEHPRQPMVYAYKKTGWSMLPGWGTPTFYFFAEGHVVAEYVGWRSDAEGVAALRRNLRGIGLIK